MISSSDTENAKPNSLLPVKSWHKLFTGKFRTEITRSWLNEKYQTDDVYSWRHNGRCGKHHLCLPIRDHHGQFSALTVQHGLNMPCLTDMCMWLMSLNIYKLFTRTCSSDCFRIVIYGDIADKMTNCYDEIFYPTLIQVASRIARIMLRSKPRWFVESNLIEKSWAGEKLLIWSRCQQWSDRSWNRASVSVPNRLDHCPKLDLIIDTPSQLHEKLKVNYRLIKENQM